jgi:hypothetical protein
MPPADRSPRQEGKPEEKPARHAGAKRGNAEDANPPPENSGDPSSLPDPETVIAEMEFTSPKGHRYRILRTTQKDPYDPPESTPPRHGRAGEEEEE